MPQRRALDRREIEGDWSFTQVSLWSADALEYLKRAYHESVDVLHLPSYQRGMTKPYDETNWALIEALLPEGWRELASKMGLIRKLPPHIGQKVHDIGVALQLVLHYVAQRGSMRMTTAAAAAAGLVKISQPALFKWIRKIGPYLEALIARMVEPGRYPSAQWGGYVLIAADATTVSRPGAKGTTARLHYALHLSDLRPRFMLITDEKVGETARHFDARPGELWIVDRGYSNPPSVLHVVEQGAEILVRVNRRSLPMYDDRGRGVDVRGLLTGTQTRGQTQSKAVRVIAADGRETAAQLCWIWLPKPEAEKARARAARDGEKDEEELRAAEYVVVLTTAPSSRLSAEQAIELYRARWQIELDFKRDKSIGQLDTLPNFLPESIHSWLTAKVLLGLIARRLACQPVALPPSGLVDAILLVASTNVAPVCPGGRTVVHDAIGVERTPRRPSAHQAA